MSSSLSENRPGSSIGVIGLGLMGTALAERLLDHGYRLLVWNRSPKKAEPLIARGAKWSANPFVKCPRIIISLYTTEVVEQVLKQMSDGLHAGRIILDTTTGDPAQTTALG